MPWSQIDTVAGAVLTLRDGAAERPVLERMVLDLHGQVVLVGGTGRPLGRAHEARTPSCSSRKSQCRLEAWCSWMTKVGSPALLGRRRRPSSGTGSGVRSGSRFLR